MSTSTHRASRTARGATSAYSPCRGPGSRAPVGCLALAALAACGGRAADRTATEALALRNQGIALLAYDRTEEAARALEAAARLAPTDGVNAAYLGRARAALGDLEGARDAFRVARTRGALDAELSTEAGFVDEQLGDLEGALGYYQAARAAKVAYAPLHLRLARLYERLDDPVAAADALADFERWTAAAESRAAADAAARAAPDDLVLALRAAEADFAVLDYAAAHERCQGILERDHGNFDALRLAGRCTSAIGDLQAAEQYLAAATLRSPRDGELRVEHASVLAALGEAERALAVATDARDRGATAYQVGRVAAEVGAIDAALRWFDEHLAEDQVSIDARLAKAEVLTRVARYDEALAVYREILTLDPENEGAQGSLAYVERLQRSAPK